MAKVCIICGNAAGSHEHVFPAALGGRRTNKGIYCPPHNNGFGRHVAELERQLSMFNAILKVRPDRRAAPKEFVFADAAGDYFSMLGEKIETAAPPSLTELGVKHGATTSLKFGSLEQFEGWKEEQRTAGWDVRLGAEMGEWQSRHFAEPVPVRLTFGGHVALQAVGYLGLTFFAQYFPDEARSGGLEPFKQFLALDFSKEEDQPKWTDGHVWWDRRDPQDLIGNNPFQFGHAVAVGVSASEKRSYAHISLFSSLNFSIDLGPVENAQERMVRVFIDPTADKAPNDWHVVHD